ncbi:MAG TPA: 50S ribosomal protein L4 [Saprospiraceae bacterium]|nr:50S ribosomal protein L4 [Saprospiraceae bacterium]
MKIDIVNTQGSATGRQAELLDSVFGIQVNEHSMYLAVKQYLANQRQGTHKAKERGEITGSTKKLFKQKGTGGARRGNIKSPLLRGGGRAFGPRPRNYGFKLNKKVKSLARNSALSSKMAAGEIKVVEDFVMETPNTKEINNILNSVKGGFKKVLLVTKDFNPTIMKAAGNISEVEVLAAKDINTYQLLNGDVILFQEGAISVVNEICSKYSKN